MAAAQCEILFKIDYTSSVTVTSANSGAYYTISGPGYPATTYPMNPDAEITLPQIQTPGNYDLEVEFTVEGVRATASETFRIGDCKGEMRKIFYNHAKKFWNGNYSNSEITFLIRKNGVDVVESTMSNTGYDDPIEVWQSFEAKPGDYIEFKTFLKNSESNGKTGGSMFTYSTAGKIGTVNGTNPTASDLKFLNSQNIGPQAGAERIFAFQVESNKNYALGTDFFQ